MQINTLGDLAKFLEEKKLFIGTYTRDGKTMPQVSFISNNKLYFINKDFKSGKISFKKGNAKTENVAV